MNLPTAVDDRIKELEDDALALQMAIRQSNSNTEIRQLRKLNNLMGYTIEALRYDLQAKL